MVCYFPFVVFLYPQCCDFDHYLKWLSLICRDLLFLWSVPRGWVTSWYDSISTPTHRLWGFFQCTFCNKSFLQSSTCGIAPSSDKVFGHACFLVGCYSYHKCFFLTKMILLLCCAAFVRLCIRIFFSSCVFVLLFVPAGIANFEECAFLVILLLALRLLHWNHSFLCCDANFVFCAVFSMHICTTACWVLYNFGLVCSIYIIH